MYCISGPLKKISFPAKTCQYSSTHIYSFRVYLLFIYSFYILFIHSIQYLFILYLQGKWETSSFHLCMLPGMENLKTCWAFSQDLIICKLQLVPFLQKTFHGECDCSYQTHSVQITLLRICSNKCQQSSCFSCWSQLKLKAAIYHQISAKLHRKFPLTVVPLIHGNLSRVSRETFFYFILVCSRNWNHPVLSHMPFAEPLTTAKQILRNPLFRVSSGSAGPWNLGAHRKQWRAFPAWPYQPSHHKNFLFWLNPSINLRLFCMINRRQFKDGLFVLCLWSGSCFLVSLSYSRVTTVCFKVLNHHKFLQIKAKIFYTKFL